MNKNSKKLKSCLLFGALMSMSVLTGCNENNPGGEDTPVDHTHTYASVWSNDETNHWHAATCEHTTEKKDSGAHAMVADTSKTDIPSTETVKGTHYVKCSVCGYESSEELPLVDHTHTYATSWTTTAAKHWHAATCEHTDQKKDEGNHTMVADTSKTDVPATETTTGKHWTKCSVCGFESYEQIPTIPHTHTFSDAWSKDATNHWHAATCAHTDQKKDTAAHTMVADTSKTDIPSTETVKGKHFVKCSVCGYESYEELPLIDHTHTFADTWTSDETNHWHAATCAHTSEKKDSAAHTMVDDTSKTDIPATETEFGTHYVKCSVCGYESSTQIEKLEHTHKFDTAWTNDETNHWHASTCGHDVKDSVAAHNFIAGEGDQIKCSVCDYSMDNTLSLDKTKIFIDMKESAEATLTATIGTEVAGKTLAFTSSDENILEVDNDGKITAKNPGIAFVTATYGGLTKKCDVIVDNLNTATFIASGTKPADNTWTYCNDTNYYFSKEENHKVRVYPDGLIIAEVAAIKGGQPMLRYGIEETGDYKVTIDYVSTIAGDSDETSTNMIYKGSDGKNANHKLALEENAGHIVVDRVALTSEEYYQIKPAKVGAFAIKVTFEKLANPVIQTNVESLELSTTNTTGQINATVVGESDAVVSFVSDNENVVTVNETGLVTVVGAGSANVKLTYRFSEKTIPVTVTSETPTLVLDQSSVNVDLNGETTKTVTLNASVTGVDAPVITWDSDNENVATVSGGVVTILNQGVATVTAHYEDQSLSCVFNVDDTTKHQKLGQGTTLSAGKWNFLSDSNNSFDTTEGYFPYLNTATNELVVRPTKGKPMLRYKPAEAGYYKVDIDVWCEQANASFEYRNNAGTMEPITLGEENNSAHFTCDIADLTASNAYYQLKTPTANKVYKIKVVFTKLSVVKIDKMVTDIDLTDNKTVQLNASEAGCTWTSSNTDIATVDSNGLVTAVSEGRVEITASKDGFASGKTVVFVSDLANTVNLGTTALTTEGEWFINKQGSNVLSVSHNANLKMMKVVVEPKVASDWSRIRLAVTSGSLHDIDVEIWCINAETNNAGNFNIGGTAKTFTDYIHYTQADVAQGSGGAFIQFKPQAAGTYYFVYNISAK